MIRRAGELRLASGNMFRRDAQTIALEYRDAGAITCNRRTPYQIERTNFWHHSLSHAGSPDHRALIPFHPDMFGRLPMRHEFADLFRHCIPPTDKQESIVERRFLYYTRAPYCYNFGFQVPLSWA